MERVARLLLGEPNPRFSTATILRWGNNGSLAVDLTKSVFFNNEQKVGGGVLDLIGHVQLIDHDGAWAWFHDQFPETKLKPNGHDPGGVHIVKAYPYVDADGTPLSEVCRKQPKGFVQRRRGHPGEKTDRDGWVWTTRGVKQVLYRLPEVLAAVAAGRTIWVVEGEKDVDTLWAAGLAATTNAGGAGKWRAALNQYLRGADVVVVADNDPQSKDKDGELLWHDDGQPVLPGQDHAAAVALALAPVAARVRLLDLGKVWPNCPPKGDASDFLGEAAVADLEALAAALPDYAAPEGDVRTVATSAASHSDSGLAAAYAAFTDTARYDGIWRTWDGARWEGGGELRVLAGVRAWLDAEIVPAVKGRKERLILQSDTKLNAVARQLRLATLERPESWDRQHWLLNTPAGTWELRGQPRLREHRRGDLITKITVVAASGDCPRWLTFIEFVTNGDTAFAAYLQRLCGYALVGLRTPQMFAFLYGSGGNGKGVLLQTITALLGDYAAWTMAEVWLESRYPRHSEELMALRGARLVVASEFPEDGEWNTARLKTVSGGDKIRAAFKHQNSVEFQTTALLILAGNDKPALKTVDPGIVRRLHLVPFLNQIDDEHRIEGLADEFVAAEGGGILKWMIDGCRLWQQTGLSPPRAVTAATGEYLEDENLFVQWIDDRLDCGPGAMTDVARLFNDWKAYAINAGVSYGTSKGFSQQFAKAGFTRYRNGGKRYFDGVRLKLMEESEAPF
jgi:putative DNA primase/helicase